MVNIDASIIEVLSVIGNYPDRATWYPLARRTKHNISGLLRWLVESGYI
jgi:hypothetical protein